MSGSSADKTISLKKRDASATREILPVSKRLLVGKKAPAKVMRSNLGTASSEDALTQSGTLGLAASLCPSPASTGKTHSGVSGFNRQQKPTTPSSCSSSNLPLSARIQVRAFVSSENGIARFCRSAGATLGSLAPISLSERPSIRAAVVLAGTDEIGTSRMICSDRSLAKATSLAISRSPHTKSANMFRLESERSSVSKPSPDEVPRTAFHSLKLLNADAGIEYARIGVSSSPQLTRFRNEIRHRPFCSLKLPCRRANGLPSSS